MKNAIWKVIISICYAIILSAMVTSCVTDEYEYYNINIHCRKINVELKLISKGYSLVYKGDHHSDTDVFFKWEYEDEFKPIIFESDSLVVYKIENKQITDSILFVKSNNSGKNLLLPQNYKKRQSESYSGQLKQTKFSHIEYNYNITEDYFASDDYVNPLLD